VTGAALAALVLGGGAVSCTKGSDDSPQMSPAGAVAKAAKNSDAITSLRYRMTGKVPGQGRIKGEAAMSMKPMAMSMKMAALDQLDPEPVELRLVGGVLYMGGGQSAAKKMDGVHWIKFDISGKEGGTPGVDSSRMEDQVKKNPAQESTFLTRSKNVKKVGDEKVGGVETTHYAGTVTLAELRAGLKGGDAATRKGREKSLKEYEDMGIERMTMDMWIDGDDHTKQFRMRGKAGQGPLDMTITFLDYNKPVTVKAPPAKDTADLAEMMKAAQSG